MENDDDESVAQQHSSSSRREESNDHIAHASTPATATNTAKRPTKQRSVSRDEQRQSKAGTKNRRFSAAHANTPHVTAHHASIEMSNMRRMTPSDSFELTSTPTTRPSTRAENYNRHNKKSARRSSEADLGDLPDYDTAVKKLGDPCGGVVLGLDDALIAASGSSPCPTYNATSRTGGQLVSSEAIRSSLAARSTSIATNATNASLTTEDAAEAKTRKNRWLFKIIITKSVVLLIVLVLTTTLIILNITCRHHHTNNNLIACN